MRRNSSQTNWFTNTKIKSSRKEHKSILKGRQRTVMPLVVQAIRSYRLHPILLRHSYTDFEQFTIL